MPNLYHRTMAILDRYVPEKAQPLWQHPAGPKTVFFWAPVIKWGLVLAGISDLKRPAEKLSIAQPSSLVLTAVIWGRYSMVIIPKNYSLLSVNCFLAGTQFYQLSRAIKYKYSLQTVKDKIGAIFYDNPWRRRTRSFRKNIWNI